MMRIDFDRYLADIDAEIARGVRRAAKGQATFAGSSLEVAVDVSNDPVMA